MVWLSRVRLRNHIWINKLSLLQKRALRIMHYSNPRGHSVPLFVCAKILPLNLLYFETVSNLMYDISKSSVWKISAITLLDVVQFIPTIPGPLRRKIVISSFRARTDWEILLQSLEPKYGQNCRPLEIRRLPRTAFKQKIRDLLFQIFDVGDSYVDSLTVCWIK